MVISIELVVAGSAIAALGGGLALAYNRLVRSRERVREAWSGIDVQLQRRANLVPNLVETVSAYAAHEQGVFEAVARARSAVLAARGAGDASRASRNLTRGLERLMAVAEAYPDLRAVESFVALQSELADTEEKIAYARHFYNGNVLDYNARVRRFPTLIVARAFGLKPEDFFEAELDATRSVDVHLDAGP